MLVADFARELRSHLESRRVNHVKNLISKPNDRLAGQIAELDACLNALEDIKRNFLAKDEDDAE